MYKWNARISPGTLTNIISKTNKRTLVKLNDELRDEGGGVFTLQLQRRVRLGRIAGYNISLFYDRMSTITVGLCDTNQHETFGRESISLPDKLTVGENVIDLKFSYQGNLTPNHL